MGYASDWSIELHNAAMASDQEYADHYTRQADAAEEEAFWLWGLEQEKLYDWFSDRMIDYKGKTIELTETVRFSDDRLEVIR